MRFSKIIPATAILLALSTCAAAQSTGQATAQSHLYFIVTDPAGAVIPGAAIELESESTGVIVRLESNAKGQAEANAIPGDYKLSVQARGFSKQIQPIHVDKPSPYTIEFSLKLASGAYVGGPIDVVPIVVDLPLERTTSDLQIPPVFPKKPLVLRAGFKPKALQQGTPTSQTTHLEITVLDKTGARIPGALVQIDAIPCFDHGSKKADAGGTAQFEVAPGHHSISVNVHGFKPAIKQIDIQSGQPLSLQIVLDIGQQAEPVTVLPNVQPEITQILLNGTILTGECLSEGNPKIVQAMALANGWIYATGTTEEIKRFASAKTQLRDLHGAFVMPGLNDAHVHLGGAGQTKLNVDLTGSKSLDEMLSRVRTKADHSPAGHWLTGGGWDHTLWANKTLPTRQDLDKVTGDHPALLERIDGHIAVANTAALQAAKITGQSKAPQGGSIDLDSKGEPTGILRDTAMEQVETIIPPPTHEERREGLSLAIADALSHGLTSVQDYSEWDDFLTFEELENEDKLGIRISEWLTFLEPLDELKAHRAHHSANDPMLHTGMLKGFMDGSLGSRTAALKAPYADDPKNSGLARYDQAKLNAMAIERAQAGFQIGFHAIGDLATSMALEAFSQPVGDGKLVATGHRDRIEHAQVVDPADITRFAKLGVIASMQPNHLLTDMNWAEDRLGPQRAAYSYAWKAYLDQGVALAFGTDYPVEPVTPFRGIYAAVTRMNEAGTKTYFPENKLTIGQALYAYTQGSAYAEFEEQKKGKLAPGDDADFIILDRNLLTVAPAEILKTRVLETIVAGKTEYKAQ